MKKIQPESLKSLVHNCISQIESTHSISEDQLYSEWKRIVGEQAVLHAKPISIYNNKLKIGVDNSSWVHHLHLQKRSILKELQRVFGKDQIEDMRFVIQTNI